MNTVIQNCEKLINYIEKLGYTITIHSNAPRMKVLSELIARHNIHKNLFCVLVKSDSEAWNHCIECQRKVMDKLQADGSFFGMCYAGMEEYVYPIGEQKVTGFVSVSGYGINREEAESRINSVCKRYFIDKNKLFSAYDTSLIHTYADKNELDALIPALCNMLNSTADELWQDGKTLSDSANQFTNLLRYIDRNFTEKLNLSMLSDFCSCSVSSLSHSFKSKTGVSLPEYIRQKRIEKACRLLESTSYNISEISQLVGYTDPDYFICVFTKFHGMSPGKYRKYIKTAKK